MNAIYHVYKNKANFDLMFIFVGLQNLKNDEIFELVKKSHTLLVKPKIIVDCDDHEKSEVIKIADELQQNNLLERIIFVTNKSFNANEFSFNVDIVEITHQWSDLTEEFQNKLLERAVKFQGKEIKLGKIIDAPNFQQFPENIMKDKVIKISTEIKFDEIEFYIERTMLPPDAKKVTSTDQNGKIVANGYYFTEHSVEDFLQVTEKFRTILIKGVPGIGKSFEHKMMAKRLKERFPEKWIVFMDLKMHQKTYRKDGKTSNTFNFHQEVANFLCERILKLEAFEAEVFYYLYNTGRVIILLDEFDEVCPNYKIFVTNMMQSIREESSNQLWISARPTFAKELAKILQAKTFRLKTFTKENQIEFCSHFLRSQNLDQEKTLLDIENFLISLKMRNFFNPGLLETIVEFLEENSSCNMTRENFIQVLKEIEGTKLIWKA